MTLNDLLKTMDEYSNYDIHLRWYSVGANKFYDLGYSKQGTNDFEIKRIIDGLACYDLCCYIDDEQFKKWFSEYKNTGFKMRELV